MAVWRPRARDSLEDVEETRQRLSQQTPSLNGALADPPLGPVACTFSNQSVIYGNWPLHHNTFSHPYSCPPWATWSLFKGEWLLRNVLDSIGMWQTHRGQLADSFGSGFEVLLILNSFSWCNVSFLKYLETKSIQISNSLSVIMMRLCVMCVGLKFRCCFGCGICLEIY